MPVASIDLVTKLIIKVIKDALVANGFGNDVFPNSISRNEEKAGLSFFLYHIQENAHHRNQFTVGRDQPPVKITPLGLNLYYQLCANSAIADNGNETYSEQELISIALKALHDQPIVSIGTDKYRISLQQMTPADAVHNWTAGSSALRLSAYYEVSPVFLEPEPPTLVSGRVLSYANFVFASGNPRIIATGSITLFTIPGELTPREIRLQPAQVVPNQDFTVQGSGLTESPLIIRLFHPRWKVNVIAPTWNITTPGGVLTITARDQAKVESTGVLVDVLPGVYSIQLVANKVFSLPGGGTKTIQLGSNQYPLTILPVVTVSGNVGRAFTISGSGFQVDDGDDTTPDEMEVYIGQFRLERRTAAPATGQFNVTSPTSFQFVVPVAATTGDDLPLRVLVAGAESAPVWINIPL